MRRGLLLLLGGPAGSGKTTLGRAWCRSRELSVLVELDAVRDFIVGGRVDPQRTDLPRQPEQYELSVRACWGIAYPFLEAGYDVVVEEVFEPDAYERLWRPMLDGVGHRVVIVHPSLEETLERSGAREKRVWERHTRAQHRATGDWPAAHRIDTTGLSISQSLGLLDEVLGGL